MAASLKQKTARGVLWSGMERFSTQGIQFIVVLIMSQVLTPSDYGLVGMLAIFLTLSATLLDSGFTNALIQKKERTETDYFTVFYLNIVISLALYLILFFCAPAIARFYDAPPLTTLTRVIALSLVINAMAMVPRTTLTIRLNFKTQTKVSLIGAAISSVVGITMAYTGYGVWAIVAQNLTFNIIDAILLWRYSGWRPKLIFSWESSRQLFAFGSRLMLSGILDTVYRNIYTMVIGRKYTAADVGCYHRAEQFAQFPSDNLTQIVQRVTYPALCSIQDEEERLTASYRKLLKLATYIVFPLMVGLAILAEPVILVLLNVEWLPTAPIMAILCLSFLWYPVHAINLNILLVKGQSGKYLKLEIVKRVIGIGVLFATLPFGILPMCWGIVLTSLIWVVLSIHYSGRLIGLGLWKQLKAIAPNLLYALSMGVFVYFFVQLFDSNLIKLVAGTVVGGIYYLTVSRLARSEELEELRSLVKPSNK